MGVAVVTIYLTSPDGTILDRYSPPRILIWGFRALAAVRRAWRAFRSAPSLGRIRLDGPQAITGPADEVVSALVNLGMKKREAAAAVQRVKARDFDGMLREVLGRRVA